jgi:hypothetical protein
MTPTLDGPEEARLMQRFKRPFELRLKVPT